MKKLFLAVVVMFLFASIGVGQVIPLKILQSGSDPWAADFIKTYDILIDGNDGVKKWTWSDTIAVVVWVEFRRKPTETSFYYYITQGVYDKERGDLKAPQTLKSFWMDAHDQSLSMKYMMRSFDYMLEGVDALRELVNEGKFPPKK